MSMEHVVDKLAKFLPLVSGAPGDKRPPSSDSMKSTAPGRDLRIEALLNYATGGGFPSSSDVDDRNKENGDYQEKIRHLSQTSSDRSSDEKDISKPNQRTYSHMGQTGFLESDASSNSFDRGRIPNNTTTGFPHPTDNFSYGSGPGDTNNGNDQNFGSGVQQNDGIGPANSRFFPRSIPFYVGGINTQSGSGAVADDIISDQDAKLGYNRDSDVRDLSGKNTVDDAVAGNEERRKNNSFLNFPVC